MMGLIFHIIVNCKINKFLRLHKAFANGLSADLKLSKTQLNKIGQSGGSFKVDF